MKSIQSGLVNKKHRINFDVFYYYSFSPVKISVGVFGTSTSICNNSSFLLFEKENSCSCIKYVDFFAD